MRVETGPRIHQAQLRTRHCHRRGPRGQQEFFEQDAHYPAVGGKRESPHYHRAAFHGRKGDILGHENMGEVVKVGSEVKNLKVGDRVVVPFTIACGECFFCRDCFYSGCERTNLDHEKAAELWGNSPAGLFGYFHPPKHQSPGLNDELFIIHVELVETNPFPIWSY